MSKVINQRELYRALRDAFRSHIITGNLIINIDDYDVIKDYDVKGEVTNVTRS